MADRSLDQYQALVTYDERFNATTLDDKSGSPASSYTQRGPVAGVPLDGNDSNMVLRATGTPSQDGELGLLTSRAGMPDDRAAIVWRDVAGGDSASQFKGWEGPELVTGWEALKSATSAAANREQFTAAITLQSGGVLASVGQSGAAAGGQYPMFLEHYTPAAGWTSLGNVSPGNAADQKGPGLVQLPSGRILLFVFAAQTNQVDVLASDDDGASWSSYSRRVLNTPVPDTDTRRIAVAYSGRELLMLVQYDDGGSMNLAQYASGDLGKSFDAVDTDYTGTASGSDEPDSVCAIGLDDGTFLVGYLDNAATEYVVAAVSAAGTNIAQSTRLVLGAAGGSDQPALSLYQRATGQILAFFHLDSSTSEGSVTLMTSDDGGVTFDNGGGSRLSVVSMVSLGSNNEALYNYSYAESGGRGLLVTRWRTSDGSNSYDTYSTACCYLGGFTDQTAPLPLTSTLIGADWGLGRWTGWPQRDDIPTQPSGAGPWLPVGDPQYTATATGASGGTVAMTADRCDLSTTAAAHHWTIGGSGSSQASLQSGGALFAEFEFRVDSGGSVSAMEVGAEIELDRSTASGIEAVVQIRASTTAFQIYDTGAGAAVGSNVTLDMTTFRKIRILVDAVAAEVLTWYTTDAHLRVWTAGPSGSLTATGGTSALGQITWGHLNSTTSASAWKLAAVGWGGASGWNQADFGDIGDGWTNPDDLRGIPVSGAYQYLHDDVRIAAVDGPACVGDRWTTSAAYEYPATALLPTSNPSPSRPWESVADNTEMSFVFDPEADFTEASFSGTSLLVGVYGSVLREFYFEGWDGAAWNQLIHAEGFEFFDGLKYARKGGNVAVDTGQSQTAERYFFREAHAGDVFDFGTTDPYVLRTIKNNTEGAFTDSTTVRPTLILEPSELDGSEPSSGTGKVWRRDFAGITHAASGYQKYRLRIPAHKTPIGRYRIGSLFIGTIAALGTPNDRGFSNAMEFNVDYGQSPSGRRSARRRGPPRRSVEFALANTAVDLSDVQADSPVPHYVTPNGSDPIAAVADTSRQIEGVILRASEAGLPVVYVARMDKLSGTNVETITEPNRMLYGRLRTNPRRDHVVGTEGSTEVERLNTVTVEEEV